MSKIGYLLLFILLFAENSVTAQNDNPYLHWGNKEYNEYCWELREELGRWVYLDPAGAAKVTALLKDIAKTSQDDNWLLEAELFDIYYQFFVVPIEQNPEYTDKLIELADKAERANNTPVRLRALNEAANRYRNFIKNYELAFECYRTINKELEKISDHDFPEKSEYYYYIADYYYQFRDYETAEYFFKIILENALTPFNEQIFIHARNGLGLCCRYQNNDFDKSDEWFTSILNMEMSGTHKETIYAQWEGIAKGNLGQNMYLRHKYKEAIPMLLFSLDRTLEFNDYAYAAGRAVMLADCYLELNNLTNSKKHINQAAELFQKSKINTAGKKSLFEVIGKYYIIVDNKKQALAYMDSTLRARDEYNKQFSALQLLRVEQRTGRLEQKIKTEELLLEQKRKDTYQKSFFYASGGLLVALILLSLYISLYRKKKEAYQELVRKNIAWANTEKEIITAKEKTDKSKNNNKTGVIGLQEIMIRLRSYVEEGKRYAESDITLDAVAEELHINRVYLSQAVNQCTGSNFSTFINELRIKESIRIMSDKKSLNLSLDGIGYEVGFNDRSSFYRAFKKITGLSPGEFRKNQEI